MRSSHIDYQINSSFFRKIVEIVHPYNHSQLLGRWRSGESRIAVSLGKKSVRPHLNKKLGMVA
jgi:hypothetical protein